MRSFKSLMLAATLATLPATANAAELVANGGFETGDFSGWSEFGDTNNNFVDGLSAQSGDAGGYFGPISDTGGITQVIGTVAGQAYTISMWLANEGAGTNYARISFGGQLLFSAENTAGFAYRQLTYTVLASGTQAALSFEFRNDTSNFSLDNVSVQAAVPEPGTWLMMVVGFGAIGWSCRHRRMTVKITAA